MDRYRDLQPVHFKCRSRAKRLFSSSAWRQGQVPLSLTYCRRNVNSSRHVKGTDPELDALSANEHKIVAGGREALRSLGRRTFELWMVVGRGIKVLRAKADRLGGTKAFRRVLVQNGYDSLDNSVISKLVKIMDRRREVEAWRATLSEKQQGEWSAPSTIFLHCPIFATRKARSGPPSRASRHR